MDNRDRRKKKRGKAESVTGIVFILCLIVILLVNLIVPDRQDSGREDRSLAAMPKMTIEGLLSGSFMKDFETYLSDQFAGRDLLRSLRVSLDTLGGNRLENGVYIGKSGQLLEDIEVPDSADLAANLEAISNFAGEHADLQISMMLVPDAATVLSGSLPAFASVEDQNQLFGMARRQLGDSVTWIDAVSVLNKHKTEKIYYKTDDRWTTLGAFYVFQESAGNLGIADPAADQFASYAVSGSFNGDLAALSGVGLSETEEIDIYVPAEVDDDVIVTFVDEGERRTSLYDSSALETRDQYDVFLGGDRALTDIRTVSTGTDRLLVVKDSFANCFIPFLTPYFREIVVVDPVYYSGTIQDIMDTYRITDVLFLYSGNSFFTDNNISGVFTGEQSDQG